MPHVVTVIKSRGIVNLTRSSRPSWPLFLERGQPNRRAKDFSAPNRRATDGRRIPPPLKLTMPDARLFVANLEAGERVVHEIERGRGVWLQLARGIVTVNGTEMREGDGAAIEEEPTIAIEADTDAEFLLFDLG